MKIFNNFSMLIPVVTFFHVALLFIRRNMDRLNSMSYKCRHSASASGRDMECDMTAENPRSGPGSDDEDNDLVSRLKSEGLELGADAMRTVRLSMQYLAGREGHGDLLETSSREQLEGRRALAGLLRGLAAAVRNGILKRVLLLLADLHDPDSDEARELTLNYRRQGKARNRAWNVAFDAAVMIAGGWQTDAAIQRAAELHGAKRATGYRAWEKYGEQVMEAAEVARSLKIGH
jgi:hypothetical protein